MIAGVVGKRKFTYDIWGDAVNVAARMEAHGEAGQINISEHTFQRVKGRFKIDRRGSIEVKTRASSTCTFSSRSRLDLLELGTVSYRLACRRVGINRKTGKRWLYGRTITSSSGRTLHYPGVINTRPRVISPRFLSEDERVVIADWHRACHTVRAIAAELGPTAGSRVDVGRVDAASWRCDFRSGAAHR